MTAINPTEGQCNICLEEYIEDNNTCIETLCCKKPFHKDCIEKWTGTCPICRGIWKEGLRPKPPVVTYTEDFTDSDYHPAVRFFGGIVTSRITQRTTIQQPVSNITFYPTIPPTYRETTWTTTYRTSYTNPYHIVDRPLGLYRLFDNN